MENASEQPMFALLVRPDEDLRKDIISGRVTVAIRKGYRNYAPNHELMLCCHCESWVVLADIVEVSLLRQYAISQKDIEAAGYHTREEMARKLKEYYPDLDWDTPLTVIRWENVRGRLVDDFRRKEELENDEGYCT